MCTMLLKERLEEAKACELLPLLQLNLFNTDTEGTEQSVCIIEVFFVENIIYYGHFAGTKGTVHNRKVSILERCP